MADAETADGITSEYSGGLPVEMNNPGEGAVVAGFPADATGLAVMQNIQAAGYRR